MLSIDGRLVLKFHSRQNLFSKIPWHLLKTRHLVRNSDHPKLFLKKCFVYCALPPTSLLNLHRIALHIKNDARIRPKFRRREKISFYCAGQPTVLSFRLAIVPPFTSRRSDGIGHAKMNRTSIENFSITTRRKFWLEIPLGPNFFCDASLILFRSLLSITVLYSLLRHDACPLICGRFRFIIPDCFTLIQTARICCE